MDNNMKNNKNFNKVSNIIESLTINPNPDSVAVLEEIGTNSSIDEVREMTSRALVKRNEHDSLNVVIANRGKGINDMSTVVAMSTINELLSLENKEEAIAIAELGTTYKRTGFHFDKKLLEMPYCSYDRQYKSDNLNHDVLTLYY